MIGLRNYFESQCCILCNDIVSPTIDKISNVMLVGVYSLPRNVVGAFRPELFS